MPHSLAGPASLPGCSGKVHPKARLHSEAQAPSAWPLCEPGGWGPCSERAVGWNQIERRGSEEEKHPGETKGPLAALPAPGKAVAAKSDGVGGCFSFFKAGAEVVRSENVSDLT